jgi:DNA adenine methylase
MKLVVMKNDLVGGEYAEPYAGGAGIGLFLVIEEYAERVHLNDLDRSIFAFWHSVTKNPNELCRLIETTDVTISEWKRQRDKQEQLRSKSGLDKSDLLDLGFSTFFLNRTNRSGIIRGGGVIGGIEQEGKWGIKARYNKDKLLERIRRIAKYRDRIFVYNWSASKFVTNKVSELPSKSLSYLDPPYYKSGQNLYQNIYDIEDHQKISDKVKKINKNWIVSYDNSEEVKNMYDNCKKITYSLSYSARRRYKGSEVMFISDDIDLPKFDNPARIPKDRVRRCRKEYHQENAFQDI